MVARGELELLEADDLAHDASLTASAWIEAVAFDRVLTK